MPSYLDDYLGTIAPRRTRRRSSANLPFELSPEQTTSLLGRVGGVGLSGLSATANVLDLPGSSVRDLIGLAGGGSFEKYNPFDQWVDPLGYEANENRVSGRDLLRGGGLIGKKDTWGNWAGGTALEIATDPLMWLPPLGLTKAGMLAKQTGQLRKVAGVASAKSLAQGGRKVGGLRGSLDTTLGELPMFAARPFEKATDEILQAGAKRSGMGVEDLLSSPLRKGVGVYVPGVGTVGGFNPPGTRKAAELLDRAGNLIATSAPGRVVKGLFHAPAGNQFSAEGQKLAENIYDAKREAIPEISRDVRATHEQFSPLLKETEQRFGPEIISAARRRIVDPAEEALNRVQASIPRRTRTVPTTFDDALDDIVSQSPTPLQGAGLTMARAMAQNTVDQVTNAFATHPMAGSRSLTKALPFNIGNSVQLAVPVGGQRKVGELVVGNLDQAKEIANAIRAKAKGGFSSGFHNARVVDTPQGAVVKWGRKDATETVLHEGTVGNQQLLKKAQKAATKAQSEFDQLDQAAEISKVADNLLRGTAETGLWKTAKTLDLNLPHSPGGAGDLEVAIESLVTRNKDDYDDLFRRGYEQKYLDEEQIGHLPRYVAHSDTTYMQREAIKRALQSEATMLRVPVDELPEHVVRRVTDEVAPRSAGKLLKTRNVLDKSRDQVTRHMPTAVIEQLLVDPALRAKPGTTEGQVTAAQHILDTVAEYLDPAFKSESKPTVVYDITRWAEKNKGAPGFTARFEEQAKRLNNPGAEHAISQHANDLAAYIRRHPRREMHTNTVLADQAQYAKAIKMKQAADSAVKNFLRESASEAGDVGLAEAFQAAQMNPERAILDFAQQAGISVEQASRLRVSTQTANAVSSVLSAAREPSEWAQRFGAMIDSVNNAIRAPLTIIWPSFHGRNGTTGQFVNTTSGHMGGAADYALYAQSLGEAWKTAGLLKRRGDSALIRELIDYQDVIFGKGGRGVAGEHLIHGADFQDISTEAIQVPDALKRVPGLQTAAKGYEKLLGAGRKAMEKVEFSNRVPLYIYLRKKGYEPLQAAIEVEKVHFDYSQITQFERQFMKRGLLFYTFTRRMAPLVMENLVKRPGGAMAQTIKAAGRSSGQDTNFVPEYIRDQTSVPVGGLPDGSLRYITGFGLPYEDVLGFGFPGLAGHPMQEALSRTTPLIKAPAELAFGKSLFQRGRDLEDLDPNIGRTMSNIGQLIEDPSRFIKGGASTPIDPVKLPSSLEFLIANSPLSRLTSTARTATDPRKGLGAKAMNLLTGVKLSDISPASQDATIQEAAGAARKRLGGKTFTVDYLPADVRAKLSPKEQLDAALIDALMKELDRRKKERKKAG